jgi:hypothetical protein
MGLLLRQNEAKKSIASRNVATFCWPIAWRRKFAFLTQDSVKASEVAGPECPCALQFLTLDGSWCRRVTLFGQALTF